MYKRSEVRNAFLAACAGKGFIRDAVVPKDIEARVNLTLTTDVTVSLELEWVKKVGSFKIYIFYYVPKLEMRRDAALEILRRKLRTNKLYVPPSTLNGSVGAVFANFKVECAGYRDYFFFPSGVALGDLTSTANAVLLKICDVFSGLRDEKSILKAHLQSEVSSALCPTSIQLLANLSTGHSLKILKCGYADVEEALPWLRNSTVCGMSAYEFFTECLSVVAAARS